MMSVSPPPPGGSTMLGLVTGLLFVLHNTAAQPQGRALISSPTVNKVFGGKPQLYDDYFQRADDMDQFYKKPMQMREFQRKKVKQNDHRRTTYNFRHDDHFFNNKNLYETQYEQNEDYPSITDSKQSQDDDAAAAKNKYDGLGVILGRQNPLRQLG